MNREIDYIDIIELGFKEEPDGDPKYFNQYGFEYVIITKKLTKRIYLDWAKETRLCQMVRTDKNEKVIKRMEIKDLDHLKEIIYFFTDKSNTYTVKY